MCRLDPESERVAVIAIVSDEVILLLHGLDETNRDRFLSDVEVQKAADLAVGVLLSSALLKPANQYHLPVEAEQVILF